MEPGMTTDDVTVPGLEPAGLLRALRELWADRDPAPADLAERIVFALSLEDLEVEVARLEQDLLTGAGARGEERMRTVTFASSTLSAMVTIGGGQDGVRLDGWLDGRATVLVELRGATGDGRRTAPDAHGRFAFDAVPPGLVQLIFHLAPAADGEVRGTVVTPGFQV
jgi:hypothetical protein